MELGGGEVDWRGGKGVTPRDLHLLFHFLCEGNLHLLVHVQTGGRLDHWNSGPGSHPPFFDGRGGSGLIPRHVSQEDLDLAALLNGRWLHLLALGIASSF